MIRVASLAVALFAFWLLLSGHYTPWLVASGAAIAVLVALFGLRLGYADAEGHPIERVPAALAYAPWLVKEIFKSAVDVSRIIVNPRLPISPRLVRLAAVQRTPVGVTIYANSITLTPGTITVEVDRHDRVLVVHALTAAGEAGLIEGEMARRVSRVEGAA